MRGQMYVILTGKVLYKIKMKVRYPPLWMKKKKKKKYLIDRQYGMVSKVS